MHALVIAGFVVTALGIGTSGVRWLRVVQREHYLPCALFRFAWRWWSASPGAIALWVVALAGVVATPFASWPALVTGVILVLGPPGLSLRGRTSALAWTRRLTWCAATTALLSAALIGVLGALVSPRAALCATAGLALASFAVIAVALVLLGPAEDHLAERHVADARRRLERVRPRVVAITGSYGKTSTKVYLAHLLQGRFSVVASPKSFNNRAGLSRTVNELLVSGTDVLVAEMGTYGPGEIASMCAWLLPEIAVMTAIGPVHLERFKSLERTLASKAEITVHAHTVVLNADDERLAGLGARLEAEGKTVLSCSAGGAGRERASVVVEQRDGGRLEIRTAGHRAQLERFPKAVAPGTLSNLACALGAALALGCGIEELVGRLGDVPGVENRLRSERSQAGLIVLDDTFNANPAGARVALDVLASAGEPGARKVVVTPGMIELGPLQRAENAAFGRAAAVVASDLVIVKRTNRASLQAGALAEEGVRVVAVETREDAVAWVRAELAAGDVVLYENDLPDHFP